MVESNAKLDPVESRQVRSKRAIESNAISHIGHTPILKLGEVGRSPILNVKQVNRLALAYKIYLAESVTHFWPKV